MQSQIGIGELWASPYTIRTSGTYKFAAQATTLVFEAYGAFGGGQDGAVSLGGNGASGPPYIKKTLTGLVIGTTYNVVVGSAGANGVDGGDCYWDDGSLAKCKGGKTDGTQTTGNVGDVINLGGLGGSAGSTGGGGGGGGGGSTGAGGNGAAEASVLVEQAVPLEPEAVQRVELGERRQTLGLRQGAVAGRCTSAELGRQGRWC